MIGDTLQLREPQVHVYGWADTSHTEHFQLIGIVASPADAKVLVDRHAGLVGKNYIFIIGGPITDIYIKSASTEK